MVQLGAIQHIAAQGSTVHHKISHKRDSIGTQFLAVAGASFACYLPLDSVVTHCSMLAGNLLVVSTHTKEIHEEVHSYKCLDCCIVDMAYCATLNKAGAVTWWCQSPLVSCCHRDHPPCDNSFD